MIFSSDISRARSRAATRRATCFYFASRAQMWRHSTTFSDADAVTDAAPTPTPRRNRAMRSTPTRQSVDARVTALEAAMEKTDARSQTLARLIKCARDADDEDRAELRASVDALRASVEARTGAVRAPSGSDGGGGAREAANVEASAKAITRALEAFERRFDAKISYATASAGNYADAHVVDALRASVETLRIELATERAARASDVERLERECRALREELTSAWRAPEDARSGRGGLETQFRCAPVAVARDARVVEVKYVDDEDEDEDDDKDEPEQKEPRPELETRRRRLRALYRELQTLSA
jgi:hypothetical protein